MRFAGIHPDAVMGIDSRLAGVTVPEHEAVLKHLFFTLRKGSAPNVPVRLVREPNNANDTNAIQVVVQSGSQAGKPIGYLPRELAEPLASLMDTKPLSDKFHGHVYEIKAFPKNEGGFGYSAKMRVEFLAAPDRAPNQGQMKRVKKGFIQAYADGQLTARKYNAQRSRIGPIHTEQIDTTTVGQDKITQKRDGDEVTFYTRGRKVASASLAEPASPRTRWHHVASGLKQRLAPKITHLLKKLAKPILPQIAEEAQPLQPVVTFPQLPTLNLENPVPDKIQDSGTPW